MLTYNESTALQESFRMLPYLVALFGDESGPVRSVLSRVDDLLYVERESEV